MNSEDADALRRRIAEACRVLGGLDITVSTYGHVSARVAGSDRIFIRARGTAESGVRYTGIDDVIEVDLDGRVVDARGDGRSAPVEVHIHTEIYKRRPDVHAVAHMHPQAPVLLTICEVPLMPLFGAYDPFSLALVLGGVPTFDRSILIQTPALGKALADCMGAAHVCMMRGHGITTAANSVEEAALLAIHLNTLAEMTCRARAIGAPSPISDEDQEEFRRLLAQVRASAAPAKPGVPASASESLWRYYTRLTQEKLCS